ncbi:hypothetical protein COM97_27085 [Bacillus thuringiensis]|uniref:hypothetical protein n=1 Tax=Bacillus thuringiensis TaxID=1428 RepID=UPI000BEC2109|nr:hypothetical protein [Bacillus thuringiensis]PEF03408.1 hypothetical protein COM97_27085 [Bacillus thuringiensis]
MILTGAFEVTEVKKKTSSQLFSTVRKGDVIQFEYRMNGGYHNSAMIRVQVNGNGVGSGYAKQIRDVVDRCFEIEQIL